ncbi:MAG: ATPase [Prevotella sp.]|nr:ATPase [Candidatus Prevotella equi]
MILTADSGSTKTTWVLGDRRFSTQGINPFHMTEEVMRGIITDELLQQMKDAEALSVSEIHFFGAGCTKEKSPLLATILRDVFRNASLVEVDSDMLGAAKALFGSTEGIACILGTGANSCLYDGERIVSNVSPMGYILGDEGSGAVIGKTFLNALYKGGHQDFVPVFESETGLTLPQVIQRVYREPMPNRFLASLCPFVKRHLSEQWIEEMVVDCFRLFFRNNTRHYNRPDLACSFVGSVAYYFEAQLRMAAKKEGSLIGRIMKEPL